MAIGWTEIIIVLLVVLILFGPTKLPKLARSLGRSIGEYKKGLEEGPSKPEKSGKNLKG